MTVRHYKYDIFISHNRADKEWARELARKIAAEEYNGRLLRPWLDEQFLDPGDLKSDEELTTALDRSRLFGLVLSPESVASFWVNFEIDHFLKTRREDSILLLLRKTCQFPEKIKTEPTEILDFRDDKKPGWQLDLLWTKLKPAHELNVSSVQQKIDAVFHLFEENDPGGFYAEPTRERDHFYNELSKYTIDDPALEGFAMAAFTRSVMHLNTISRDLQYNFKMLLGDCLAVSLLESNTYRQVAQHFLSLADQQDENTSLLFVLVRAFSKLAETDIRQIDLSILLRIVYQLDKKKNISNEEKALEGMLVHIAGKIRELPLGELFIKTLSEGGTSSKIIAAGAIAFHHKQAPPVFYLSLAEENYNNRIQEDGLQNEMASRKLLSLLFDLSLDKNARVFQAAELAKQDIRRANPDVDFPYGYFWLNSAKGITVSHIFNGPFLGSIVKVTVGNMSKMAFQTHVANVVCLTEERIVESLFDQCSAFLIPEQDPESLLCKRLRSRRMPIGMITPEMMQALKNGDHIMVSQKQITLWKNK